MTVSVTGLSCSGIVGSVSTTADANVSLTGVSASGEVGSVLVWGTIVPNQNPSYTPIAPTQTPSWGEETPAQTPNWTNIAA